jgi:alginate O-acetyltransferase complex protein AlgI
MQFTSLEFALFVVVAATVASWVRGAQRLYLLIGLNVFFAATYIPTITAVIPLGAFVLTGYLALWLVERGKIKNAVAMSLGLLVASFIWLKHYPFVAALPILPISYVTVGLSYILFRLLHLILEVGGGMMKRPSFLEYLAYIIFFPAFLSGPINRYEPFARDLAEPTKLDSEAAFACLTRFLRGLAKVSVIGECVLMMQRAFALRLDVAVAGEASGMLVAIFYAIAASLYLVFLYANFSGYTDMAISVGRLFGFTLPENFSRPFMANNFQDFWSRWHITLSDWFKIYFFNPLLKTLMRQWPSAKAAPYLGVAALFVVFLVLGAWHGASWEFMLCGLLLATGVGTNKLYQVEITKRLGKKPYQQMTKRPSYIWASRGVTLAWVALALTPFWVSVSNIALLVAAAGPVACAAALLIMSISFACTIFVLSHAEARMAYKGSAVLQRPRAGVRILMLGAAMVLLAFAVPMVNSSSEFVYKAF